MVFAGTEQQQQWSIVCVECGDPEVVGPSITRVCIVAVASDRSWE